MIWWPLQHSADDEDEFDENVVVIVAAAWIDDWIESGR